jgi:hypothetical protein
VQSDIRGFLSSLSRELAAGLGLREGKKIGCVCVSVCVELQSEVSFLGLGKAILTVLSHETIVCYSQARARPTST